MLTWPRCLAKRPMMPCSITAGCIYLSVGSDSWAANSRDSKRCHPVLHHCSQTARVWDPNPDQHRHSRHFGNEQGGAAGAAL